MSFTLESIQQVLNTVTGMTTSSSSNQLSGLGGGLGSQGVGQAHPLSWPNFASTTTYAPPSLTPDNAKDLMEQYDHDGVLVKDNKLLFGKHMTMALRTLPLDYIVGLSQACRTLRRALVFEVRRRRIMNRVMPTKV